MAVESVSESAWNPQQRGETSGSPVLQGRRRLTTGQWRRHGALRASRCAPPDGAHDLDDLSGTQRSTNAHLAELSLWLGGSPLHEDSWLRLAYFSDFGKRLELNVLFEKDFSELLAEVLADNRRFEPEQFSWAGIPASKHSGAEQPSSILGIRRSSLKPNQAASTQSTS